jgi:hypothetical protein
MPCSPRTTSIGALTPSMPLNHPRCKVRFAYRQDLSLCAPTSVGAGNRGSNLFPPHRTCVLPRIYTAPRNLSTVLFSADEFDLIQRTKRIVVATNKYNANLNRLYVRLRYGSLAATRPSRAAAALSPTGHERSKTAYPLLATPGFRHCNMSTASPKSDQAF